MSFKDSRIVYATGLGQLCPNCRRPVKDCTCPKNAPGVARPSAVRVGRETKGRAGKGVTVVAGLGLPLAEIEQLATKLKKQCGSGGTVREGVIESRAITAIRSSRRWPNMELLPRSLEDDRLSLLNRDKSCPERVLEFDGDRRRRKGPTNAQAHERQSLAISGERLGVIRKPTEGEQRRHRALDLSGSKDRGAARISCRRFASHVRARWD